MSLDTETNLDVLETLDFEMSDACEHSGHNNPKQQKWHDGSGEWWRIKSIRPACGNVGKFMLVCDKWKKTSPKAKTLCSKCGSVSMGVEFGAVYVRKDEL